MSEHAGNADEYNVVYNGAESTTTNPLGKDSSYTRTTNYDYYANTTDGGGNTVLGRLKEVDGPRTAVRASVAAIRGLASLSKRSTTEDAASASSCKIDWNTAKRATQKNYSTDATVQKMQQNLESSGYKRSVAGRNNEIVNYTKDGVTYSFYPQRGSVPGHSGVQVNVNGIPITKITPRP